MSFANTYKGHHKVVCKDHSKDLCRDLVWHKDLFYPNMDPVYRRGLYRGLDICPSHRDLLHMDLFHAPTCKE